MRQNPHVRICGGPGSATTLVYPTNEGWRRKGTSVERCLRNALQAAAPVGSTSAWAEVTASGTGRLCAEQISCARRLSGV